MTRVRRCLPALHALAVLLMLVMVVAVGPSPVPVLAQTAPPIASPTPRAPAGAPTGPALPASQDRASYDLRATWDTAHRQIRGAGVITYRNDSPDVLSSIWIKLYLNAFRGEQTTWMRESSGQHRGSDYDPAQPGWIDLERLTLAQTGESLLPATVDPLATTVEARLPAARAIQPGETVQIEIAWTSQLPRVFARTGVAGDFVMAGQWYPKLAVYDRGAWDTEPWHANAEFFADFGSYSLALTVPSSYLTGASGTRVGSMTNPDGTTTTRYLAESVSDIAWTAWPEYRLSGTVVEVAGRPIELELLTPRSLPASTERRYFTAAQVSLDAFGRWFGPYPWPKLTLVVPPDDAEGAGGMEYPSLVTLELPVHGPLGIEQGVRIVEIVTAHEIAHQWSPLQLASNEGREAWLDEGFADYATIRVLAEMFPADRTMLDLGPVHFGYEESHRTQFLIAGARERLAQPSWEYSDFLAYGVTVYSKGALVLLTLEKQYGEERFLRAMHDHADRWRWRHPTTTDLQQSLEASLGEPLDWFFGPLVFGAGVVEYGLEDVSASGATVLRQGDVPFPVEIALTYADGRTDLVPWDGVSGRLRIAGVSGQLARVQIDPSWKIRLELNRLDNGQDVSPSPLPLATLLARVLGVVQAALLVGMPG
ncbi:MAG: M1 family metallopeptidase [Chloroflexi bacterium]|nr:M1 family metallopeptidase [Chloroflexota bacterium]